VIPRGDRIIFLVVSSPSSRVPEEDVGGCRIRLSVGDSGHGLDGVSFERVRALGAKVRAMF
jgi:hypothetical protein